MPARTLRSTELRRTCESRRSAGSDKRRAGHIVIAVAVSSVNREMNIATTGQDGRPCRELVPRGSTTANSSVSRPYCPPMERSALSAIKHSALLEHGGRALLSTTRALQPSIPGRASLTHFARNMLWRLSITVINNRSSRLAKIPVIYAQVGTLFSRSVTSFRLPKQTPGLYLLVPVCLYLLPPFHCAQKSRAGRMCFSQLMITIHSISTLSLSARPLVESR